jgi:hypothetical protein
MAIEEYAVHGACNCTIMLFMHVGFCVVFNYTEREVKRGNPTPFSYILYFFMTFIKNSP